MPKLNLLASNLVFIMLFVLIASCGSGGGGGNSNVVFGNNTYDIDNNDGRMPGIFLPASTSQSICATPPVPGTNDRQGTATDGNNFLRSYSTDTYLWYDEIVDREPALFTTPAYFDLLKTEALAPSGKFKDQFHFTIPTDKWTALSQSGSSVGYGGHSPSYKQSHPVFL
jgi:carboxyl-terminal processing protease